MLCGNLPAQTVVKMNMPQQADEKLDVTALFDEEIPEGIPVVLGTIGYDVTGGMMPYSFQWILNGQVTSTDDILTFTPKKGDNLSLEVTDGAGCWATTSFNLKVARLDPSTEMNNVEQDISIYPTVVTDHINVKIPEKLNEKVLIKIFDPTGRPVKTENISGSKSISMTLKPGVYFISAETGDTHVVRKIIVK